MFIITLPVDTASVDLIEDHLFMIDECPWTLMQAKPSDPFFLQGFFNSREAALKGWEELMQDLSFLPSDYTIEEIPDHQWQNAYKAYLRPWNTEHLYWIPTWQADAFVIPEGAVRVIVDAGMAFGSGCHETTRLCAERLVECYKDFSERGELDTARVIDAGCGSGILAISARLLGFKHVEGFDNDPDSIAVSIENLEINGLSPNAIAFEIADLNAGLKNKQGDIILANILAPVLITHVDILLTALAGQGTLILSGILATEHQEVETTFSEKAQALWPNAFSLSTHNMGEWVDVIIQRVE